MADPQLKLPPGAALESAHGSMPLPPGAMLEGGGQQQPSTWQVLTQPTDKTDKEYLGYTGPAGVAGATIHGFSNVARGVGGALKGIGETFDPSVHLGEETIGDTMGAPGLIARPLSRIAKGVTDTAKQAREIPGAIRDINHSADPTNSYLDAAQDTAAQGAGQALTAIGTEGLGRSIAPVSRLGSRTAEAVINQKLVPLRAIVNLNTPADEAGALHFKVPGRDFGLRKPFVDPGAPLPESPGYNPGAPFPEHPGVFPGAPNPLTPAPELLQARSLFTGGSAPPPEPSAGLGKIPVRGSIADSMRQPAAAVTAPPEPWLKHGSLQNLLQDALGGKPLDPKVPLKQQMPATAPLPTSAPAPTPKSAPSARLTAEPEHMGQFARANGLELHQAIPESVQGDVLRAKIHDLTNVQVRQLAINAGEDMGQQSVTNAKNAGGVTRQAVLSRILAKHTPEEIGQMIDQGQHLPPGAQRGSIAASLAGRNGR